MIGIPCSYGELSSGALLMKYGFTDSKNPHRIVNVDANIALAAAEAHGGTSARHVGEELLQTPGLFDDDGLFEIGASGDLPAALVFFAYCVAGGAPPAFTATLAADPVRAATTANKDDMLGDPATQQYLQIALAARLSQYNPGNGTALRADLTGAVQQLAYDEKTLLRLESVGRNPYRTNALRLRVEEQRLLLTAANNLRE